MKFIKEYSDDYTALDKFHELEYSRAHADNYYSKNFFKGYYNYIVGYGYKPPHRAPVAALTMIFMGAILICMVNAIEILTSGSGVSFSFHELFRSIYFSSISFTTTGFGDIAPYNYHSGEVTYNTAGHLRALISTILSLNGVAILSLFISSYHTRFSRREKL